MDSKFNRFYVKSFGVYLLFKLFDYLLEFIYIPTRSSKIISRLFTFYCIYYKEKTDVLLL